MSDLETRLSEGLSEAAGRAPHPPDLAAGARDRLRRRRRTTSAVVVAAVVAITIPVGVAVVGGAGGDGPDRRDPTTVTEPPRDWRTETYRDLSVSVLPEWGFGGATDWCARGRTLEETGPYVSRPGTVRAIDCSPSFGYGVHFSQPSAGELPPGTEGAVQRYRGDRYPDGAWIGYASTQQAAVWVVADDRTTARQVLDSAAPAGEVDANGCATRVERLAPGTDARVSVCRYDSGALEQSERLSRADSAAAVAAVGSARAATAVDPACPPYSLRQPVITMQSVDLDARVLPSQRCNLAGVFLEGDGAEKRLSEDVLYWALSPGWSGWVPRDVPLPDRLRGQ